MERLRQLRHLQNTATGNRVLTGRRLAIFNARRDYCYAQSSDRLACLCPNPACIGRVLQYIERDNACATIRWVKRRTVSDHWTAATLNPGSLSELQQQALAQHAQVPDRALDPAHLLAYVRVQLQQEDEQSGSSSLATGSDDTEADHGSGRSPPGGPPDPDPPEFDPQRDDPPQQSGNILVAVCN